MEFIAWNPQNLYYICEDESVEIIVLYMLVQMLEDICPNLNMYFPCIANQKCKTTIEIKSTVLHCSQWRNIHLKISKLSHEHDSSSKYIKKYKMLQI